MILSALELNFFRKYVQESIRFDRKTNIFSGKNAQGKTNILEAMYLLCISRSFRTRHEREAVNFESDFFTIKGEFCLDNGNVKNVIFHFTRDEGKQVTINRKRINKLSDYIGQFPIVLSSPEEYSLTSGPPAERRRFIDILLSQISIKYIHNLQDYYRIVKQRNKILSDRHYSNHKIDELLEPWNESLIEKGSRIVFERVHFSEKFNDVLKNVYSNLAVSNENLDFQYNSKLKFPGLEEINKEYREKLDSITNLELKQGITLLGPHRDDFIFKINGKELRKFGSRGQHKTVLIALTIAELKLIKEKINETPIILIDDLFSEIDRFREERIMNMMQGLGQTFITTTIEIDEAKKYSNDASIRYFYIDNGKIKVV